MSHPLFSPFQLRSVTFANRIGVSPMCQYSSRDGFASEWHFVHLGARAQGGAGLVTLEASAVLPEGRISPGDLGIWKDAHIPELQRIARFIHSQGVRAGIQLAHAGRKGSMTPPFGGERLLPAEEGGWQPDAPLPSLPITPRRKPSMRPVSPGLPALSLLPLSAPWPRALTMSRFTPPTAT
jgi:2,4-dienoyl-CoA reductase-like NADH-dependent reductase (Old Yellow Enzyme family)